MIRRLDNVFNSPNSKHSKPLNQQQPVIVQARGSSHPKSVFNLPPKKVIKSVKPYTAKYVNELSFSSGDFFFVLNETDGYYEVVNPVARTRGLVPIHLFKDVNNVNQNNNTTVDTRWTSHTMSSNSSGASSLDPPSPMMTRQATISSNTNHPEIQSASVKSVDLKSVDNQFYYTVEIEKANHTKVLLFRTYNDFWALHVYLLSYFSVEGGRTGSPRSIPFLEQPLKSMTLGVAQKKLKQLDVYIRELFQLRKKIRTSPCMRKFLTMRAGDIETVLDVKYGGEDISLGDILDFYDDCGQVRITIDLPEDQGGSVSWESPDSLTYNQLLYAAQDRIRFPVAGLGYKDELGEIYELQGDSDLQLIIRTYPKEIRFSLFEPNYT